MNGRTDGQKDGHGQTYSPPHSAGDNKLHRVLIILSILKLKKELLELVKKLMLFIS